MISDNFVIVEAHQNYNNTVGDIIVNSTVDSVIHINRVAKVLAAPIDLPINKGNYVIVHHNILRVQNDVKGIPRKSVFFIKDNMYWVPPSEVLMYKEENGSWKTIEPFIFVKPIKNEDIDAGKFIIPGYIGSYKGHKNLQGIVAFNNKNIADTGIKVGDTVYFTDYSQHEFVIDGDVYYKMKTEDILFKV